jgi:hypothetical protein
VIVLVIKEKYEPEQAMVEHVSPLRVLPQMAILDMKIAIEAEQGIYPSVCPNGQITSTN